MAIKTYQDSKDKYLREKVDTFVVRVPKGAKEQIAEFALKKNMSLNGYINALIFEDMKMDKPKTKASAPKTKKEPVKKQIEKEQPKLQEEVKKETPKKNNMPSFLL